MTTATGRFFLIMLASVVALAVGETALSKAMKQTAGQAGRWTTQVTVVFDERLVRGRVGPAWWPISASTCSLCGRRSKPRHAPDCGLVSPHRIDGAIYLGETWDRRVGSGRW